MDTVEEHELVAAYSLNALVRVELASLSAAAAALA